MFYLSQQITSQTFAKHYDARFFFKLIDSTTGNCMAAVSQVAKYFSPDGQLKTSRQMERLVAKRNLPRVAHGIKKVCCETFVTNGKMLFCREWLTAKSFFCREPFVSPMGK
jgi:hypothetical protein